MERRGGGVQSCAVPSSSSIDVDIESWRVVVVVARCRWRRDSLRVKNGSPARARSSSTSSWPNSAQESKLSTRYNKNILVPCTAPLMNRFVIRAERARISTGLKPLKNLCDARSIDFRRRSRGTSDGSWRHWERSWRSRGSQRAAARAGLPRCRYECARSVSSLLVPIARTAQTDFSGSKASMTCGCTCVCGRTKMVFFQHTLCFVAL